MKKLFVLAATTLLLSACNTGKEPEIVVEVERKEKESEDEVKKETFSNKSNQDGEDKTSVKLNRREENSKNQDNEESKESDEIVIKKYTDEEMWEMRDRFYEWAVERAEMGNMAVTYWYFGHGAAGNGDWYAVTPHGEVQVQEIDTPGYDYFDLHSLGGVSFYVPITGDYGEDPDAPFGITSEGYSKVAVDNTYVHKYMLVDNGIVYELVLKKEIINFNTGFGQYDDGRVGAITPSHHFKVSEDKDAQEEWQRILREYQ